MATQPKTHLTPEQYLEIERKAEFKSEYYQGEMFAMSGASYPHIGIVANAVASLHQQLRRGPCRPTPEQYLEIERKAESNSEYYQGEMFAMSGASYPHIGIVANAVASLHQQLRRGPCRPLSNDMRVRVTRSEE